MSSLAGIGLVAFLLKFFGVLWIIAGVFLFVVSEAWRAPPSPDFMGAALTNTLIFSLVATAVGWLLVGLLVIAAGYALDALNEIAKNTFERRQGRQRTPANPEGMWAEDRAARR